ncbi:MAG: hypothetical protein GXP32_01520 [Kiritimatiellaeota bacterium]|nr:hypothetical protein [Kiritimatiellota bacterium]
MFGVDCKVGWAVVLAVFSVLTMVGSLFLAFKIATAIPPDYFKYPNAPTPDSEGAPKSAGIVCKVSRNCAGVVLVAAGIAMLVLPGQGLLTIFSGLMIMDFPAKYRLERRLASISSLLKALNAIRRKVGRPPLNPP